jgi:hypothetical protein
VASGYPVEANTVVASNTIEGAPTAGISVSWGTFLRDVIVQANLIRRTGIIGIALSSQGAAESVLLSANVIRQAAAGAIRLHDQGVAVGAPARAGDTRFGPAVLSANQFR